MIFVYKIWKKTYLHIERQNSIPSTLYPYISIPSLRWICSLSHCRLLVFYLLTQFQLFLCYCKNPFICQVMYPINDKVK